MDYSNFSLADFMGDEDFREWVKNPTPATDSFWQEWIQRYPDKEALVNQARRMLLSLDFKKTPPAEIDDEKILYRIQATLQQDAAPAGRGDRSSRSLPVQKVRGSTAPSMAIYRLGWKIAAVFAGSLLVAAATYFVLFGTTSDVSYTTVYGETRTVILPDSSEILLNGNSTLHLSSDWQADNMREVWLRGEAYFKVREVATAAGSSHDRKPGNLLKFVVHTDVLDIEVVGTQFNVNTRREKTEVVLSSGKVRLKIEDQEEVVMQPGEMIGYSAKDQQVVRKIVNPEVYSSWKNNHLIFDEVPLQKVAETLQDTYGIEVVFEDAELREKVFKGVLPSDNVDVLLSALSDIYDLRISQKEKKIIFHKK